MIGRRTPIPTAGASGMSSILLIAEQRRSREHAASLELNSVMQDVMDNVKEIAMNWRDQIVTDPDLLCGKPTLKGTRLSVEFVPDLLAAEWDTPALRKHYPNLTVELLMSALENFFAAKPVLRGFSTVVSPGQYRQTPFPNEVP